ncbi:MAG TPA: hypothetical protein VGC67_06160 [Cellulomonas sp.]
MSADGGAVDPVAAVEPGTDPQEFAAHEDDWRRAAPDSGAGPAHERGWLAVLTELEDAADHAERLLELARRSDETPPAAVWWQPPRGLGPLPAGLAERAGALVERQQDLQRRTAESVVERRRSLRTAQALRTRPASVPVYLDAQA